ncbi:Retrovirus-related Pol polyprotein from transposon [Trichinella britovi]|uniref:Retrovirus-related Pol polyprotein from transposon n=1 Tax=Trichinella britovi TaxID=45882 RepID=A0A0V1C7Q3_TRIBR|nr:Retrovirus-related Pol polyprotein from transposon [Trichinella britovi]
MLALVWATRHFPPYLYGRKFTARTDHNALRWLRNFREPEGQVARWLERLAEYEFEVVHRAGQQHRNNDALSRRV